jgi:Mg-chelatase subunit ChlD
MKTKLLTLALFVLTFAAVLLYPEYRDAFALAKQLDPTPANPMPAVNLPPGQRPKIEAVFVLDTTGSMGGLIQAAKEKIWSIATSMAQGQPAPEIRIGLVAYRDRGDAYVTRVVELSSDLDSLYATLMDFRAEGGGDGPESVNQALSEAVNKIAWSPDQSVYKVVFLVGDAPPHMDYQDDVKYDVTLGEARRRGIVVNSIQCGNDGTATGDWQRVAALGAGQYFQVGQSGNAVAVATPYDKKMAELSRKLDETRLYYGSPAEQAEKKAKQDATDKLHAGSSVESQARRAAFNASKSGADNLLGGKDLVEDVRSGKVDLRKVEPARLPASLQALPAPAVAAAVEETAKKREELKQEIGQLARERSEYLKKEVAKAGGAKDSLDARVYGAVREQAKAKGLRYDEAAAPEY